MMMLCPACHSSALERLDPHPACPLPPAHPDDPPFPPSVSAPHPGGWSCDICGAFTPDPEPPPIPDRSDP